MSTAATESSTFSSVGYMAFESVKRLCYRMAFESVSRYEYHL